MILLSQKRRQSRKKSGNSFRGRTKSGVWPTYPTTKSDLQEIIKTGPKLNLYIDLKKTENDDVEKSNINGGNDDKGVR